MNTLTLKRFNGEESYSICDATCRVHTVELENLDYDEEADDLDDDFDEEKEVLEVTFVARTDKKLSDSNNLNEDDRLPSIEISFYVEPVSTEVFKAGFKRDGIPDYREDYEEWMTNLYYYSHQGIKDISIEVLKVEGDKLTAKLSGLTQDVNFYDGSKPDTKVLIEAEFEIVDELERTLH